MEDSKEKTIKCTAGGEDIPTNENLDTVDTKETLDENSSEMLTFLKNNLQLVGLFFCFA